jgi:hypothetical protein
MTISCLDRFTSAIRGLMRLLPLKALEFCSQPVLARHTATSIPRPASNWNAWCVSGDGEEAGPGAKIVVVLELDQLVLGLEYADPRVEDGAGTNLGDLLNDRRSCRGSRHQGSEVWESEEGGMASYRFKSGVARVRISGE